ncbi:unnamed protein product [Triticum turgidum subsp. durum]|uniref:Transmembrane protein n=1 Tax=Triticum turgidum subsp. durum TaxID=4567 RepID=A0A9R1A8C0_TRITD|nr:unnamed protein product [Triticum turgidum subsp. durum]
MGVKLTLPPAALISQVAKLGSLLVLLLLALLLPVFLRAVEASPFQRAGAESVRPDDRTAVVGDRVVVPAFVASNIIELKTKTKEVVLKVLKKCPSTASIFFLSALNGSQQAGGEEKAPQEEEEECDVDMDGDVRMSREELFANTERFIGNFRKELSMQRQ